MIDDNRFAEKLSTIRFAFNCKMLDRMRIISLVRQLRVVA